MGDANWKKTGGVRMSVPYNDPEHTRAWIAKAVASVALLIDVGYGVSCGVSGDSEALKTLVTANFALLVPVVAYYFARRRK